MPRVKPRSQPSILALVVLITAVACATSPLGRRQLKLVSSEQMAQMGATSFAEISKQNSPAKSATAQAYVSCVALAVTTEAGNAEGSQAWEVRVFEDASPNAFALPGGKIGVNTGLLSVAKTQDQLAAVIGHEVAHVLAGHGNERVSAEMATQSAMSAVALAADTANPTHQALIAALGAGAQVGVLLPYSRSHEREADLMGLDLMARAGFDPRESVVLWRNMSAASGQQSPEFLSTHPSNTTRISDLEARIPAAMKLYDRARSAGMSPRCG